MQDTGTVETPALTEGVATPMRQGVARAALTSGATEAATRVLMIVLSIATARALLPGQVGILGIAVIVVGVISLVAACSETAGIVGSHEGTDSQHAFAATVLRSFIVAILVTSAYFGFPIISRLLASAEDAQPQLIRLLRILLWLPAVELAAAYPRVLLQRRLDLTYLAGVSLFQVSFHVGLSVILLWLGYGAIGVVWSSLIAGSLSALVVWLRISGSRRPEWGGLPDARQRLAIIKNTLKILAGSFLGYLNGRADNLLVAAAIGPTAMGFYGMAWSASRVAPQILGQAFGFVLVPALARVQTDRERVGRALSESIRHSYLLVAPFATALFLTGPSLVSVILGQKWLPIVSCLQVMSITILLGPLVSTSSALLVATGRAHVAGLGTFWQLLVLGALIVPLSARWGVLGAAFGDLFAVGALTVGLLIATPLVRKLLRRQVASALLLPVGSAAIAGVLAWWGGHWLGDGLLKLLAQTGMLLVTYLGVLSMMGGRPALRDLVSLVRTTAQRANPVSRVAPSRA